MQHSPGDAEPVRKRNKRSETPLADDMITHGGRACKTTVIGMMEDASHTWKLITYSGVKTMAYLGIHIYTRVIK